MKFSNLALFGGLGILVAHTAMAETSAYDWGAAVTLESISNLSGGVETGTRQLGNLDITLALDTGAAGWWDKGEFFVYILGDYGKNPSDLTGDLQGISNIATDNAIKLYEFWYQHHFADDAVKLLVGLHDYNSTFYSLDSAGLFTLSSFGIGPDTSQVGPSIFSTTAMAVHLTLQGEHQYLLAAIYDGVPGDPENPRGTHIKFGSGDGLFSALEWGYAVDENYKLALGLWKLTAEVESPIDGAIIDDNSGVYLIAEKKWNEKLATFVQLGQADDSTNQIEHYFGAGITASNLWRDEDGLGLAVAHARNGDPFLQYAVDTARAETAWELTYFTPLVDFLSIQTSLYYIQNPAMNNNLDNALALGLRAYLEF